ncbi:lipopolysaccharide biosynthesis protein [Halobacillus hunanensis]|uniref:lipopolysaccharide biosynthesis protein n=1 Tax=Halobacillus hunanensis TaxID=578214 RepID=UPI0009A8618A|nr:hypothetical protein [Halobacillus hunanensis]
MLLNLKNKIYSDIILNIISSGIVAVLLQFLVYPLLSKNSSANNFGEILVMMGAINIIAVFLGNSLNNIRLIFEKEYYEENVIGDFSVILIIAGIFNVLLISVTTALLWSDQPLLGDLLLISISVLTMLRAYLSVSYRIKLDYIKILQHNLIYGAGLSLGAVVLQFSDAWQLVFFIGETFSILFLVITTEILREPLKITHKFKNTIKQYIFLSISNLIKNTLLYIDRLIIFPILGGAQVAVFFAATVIGKMSIFILNPISSVMLSYISNKNRKMTLKEFCIVNVTVLFFSMFTTFFTLIVSKYVLNLLYADLYVEASSLLLTANSGVILLASSSITQAIVLKYSSTYLQVVIQLVHGIFYIGGGLLMITDYGLKGFCIALLLSAVTKFLLIFGVGVVTLKKS